MQLSETLAPSSAPGSGEPFGRRRFGALLAGFGLTAGVAHLLGCHGRDALARTELRIGVNSTAIASAPLFVVDSQPPTHPTFTLRLTSYTSGRFALDPLLAGQADLATVAEIPVLNASLARPDLRIVGVLARSALRVIGRRSALPSPSLRGKRIGTMIGASPDYALARLLVAQGLPPEAITRVNLQAGDMLPALRNDSVDAIIVWEPLAQAAYAALGAEATDITKPGGYTEHFALVSTRQICDQKREALRDLVQATRKASAAFKPKDPEAIEVVASRMKVDASSVRNVWDSFDFCSGPDDSLQDALTSADVWLAQQSNRAPRSRETLRALIDDGSAV